ncbi:hypothetical protein KFD70_01080 [Bacillus pfraonensis]|uniref:hypothetical protein n=1 Tax=Bacillus TaxID=1386 RepID=UPI002A577CFC|nr:hypothetical protein [Bacillus pseudomycoides]HEK9104226.1 hypothetical protein [Bacillus pseudomycoides]
MKKLENGKLTEKIAEAAYKKDSKDNVRMFLNKKDIVKEIEEVANENDVVLVTRLRGIVVEENGIEIKIRK